MSKYSLNFNETQCDRCSGRGRIWKTDEGKILKEDSLGNTTDQPYQWWSKCTACDGAGMFLQHKTTLQTFKLSEVEKEIDPSRCA